MPYVYSGRLNISNLSIKKQVPESMYSIYLLPNKLHRSKELQYLEM